MANHLYDPEKIIDIRPYSSLSSFNMSFGGLSRVLPIVPVEPSLWLVDNEYLSHGCDIEFTEFAGEQISLKLAHLDFDYLVCPETKASSLSYEVARNLSIERFITVHEIFRKGIRVAFSESITSINSPTSRYLYLDEYSARELKGKRVVLLDDTISTGGTMKAMISLMEKAQAKVIALSVIWLEGPLYYQNLSDFIISDRLIFLDFLPLYSTGKRYEMLLLEKERVARTHKTLINFLAPKP